MARSSIVLSLVGVAVTILQGHAVCPNDPNGDTDICDDDNVTKADLMLDICSSSTPAKATNITELAEASKPETKNATKVVGKKPETKNATKVVGKLNFKLTLPENETAASFVKDAKVRKGVAKGIATKLKVNASWVSVVLTVATIGRRLAGTTADINVVFTINVPASSTNPATTAASLVTTISAVTTAGTSAWSSTLKMAINTETAKTYDVVVTSVAHTPPATPESPAGAASGAERASLMMAVVAAAVLLRLA